MTALAAPLAPMAPTSRSERPMIVGDDSPTAPFPLHLSGIVTKGFGRGARYLGIPTANLPDESLAPLNDLQLTGIYYGFARVHPSTSTPLPSKTSTPQMSTLDLTNIPAETAPYPPDSVAGAEIVPRKLSEQDGKVWPMVMSVGWNPYFKNEKITAEVHIMHPFEHDFYGHDMSVLVLGYIRPELDYVSKEALIQDIQTDVKVALNSLARPEYAKLASDPFLAGKSLKSWLNVER
ncbi:hypothetical protein P7C73_g3203, partial [Tremellales sp. Uapishka_1]